MNTIKTEREKQDSPHTHRSELLSFIRFKFFIRVNPRHPRSASHFFAIPR